MVALTDFNPLFESVSLPGFVSLVYPALHMPLGSIQRLSYRDRKQFRNYSHESLEWPFYVSALRNTFVQHASDHSEREKRIFEYKVDGYNEATKPFWNVMAVDTMAAQNVSTVK